jgi:hypothetical protein
LFEIDGEKLFILLVIFYFTINDSLVIGVLLCAAEAVIIIENEQYITFDVCASCIIL